MIGQRRKLRLPRRPWELVTVIVLLAVCAVWVYPFIWMISASLKSSPEVFSKGLDLIPDEIRWDNYVRAWDTANFNRYTLNTVLVTIGTVTLVVIRSALAGYVIGRYSFIGKRPIIAVLIVTLFIPGGLTIIPVLELTDNLGLLNSLWGIILALGGGGQAAAVLLYAAFFSRIPKEIEESAKLDGAGFVTIFFRIMLPLAGPVTATVVILTFLFAWNQFLLPLVFTLNEPELRTLAVGMLNFTSERETDWSGMSAAATISLLPVVLVFLFLQRYFIEGIEGAVKD